MHRKPTLRHFFRKLKSNKGFSITEVMVTAGLVAIVAVGATSLITNMQNEQRRNVLLQVLTSKKVQFENIILNPDSWSQTFENATNSNMTCLRAQTACPAGMVDNTANTVFVNNTGREIVLYNGSGNIFYDGRQSSNTAGFRESGEACTGFSYAAASGNDACPIGYVVNWRATSSTTNPQIYVVAKLVYNPSNANPFKAFFNASTIQSSISKYDANIVRTATTISKSFTIVSPGSADSGNPWCAGSGYGTCPPGSPTPYSTYNENYDPHDLVVAGTSSFGIKQNGTYRCSVVTYAFGTDAVTMELYNTSTSTVLGTSKSSASNSSWAYATVLLDTTFNITGASAGSPRFLMVRQTCSVSPSSNPGGGKLGETNIDNCALGFSSGTYSATESNKASINCVQINE